MSCTYHIKPQNLQRPRRRPPTGTPLGNMASRWRDTRKHIMCIASIPSHPHGAVLLLLKASKHKLPTVAATRGPLSDDPFHTPVQDIQPLT